MARFQYGGQALIEGVLMRGRNALAVALRHPDGSIVWATERLDMGMRARRALKLPLVRGLVLLYDTLVTGTRWLVRSATLQALEAEGGTPGPGAAGGITSALRGLAVLPAGPALCAAAGNGNTASPAPSGVPSGAQSGLGKGYNVAVGGMLLMALVFGIGLFFLVPLALAQATVGRVDQGIGLQFSEGLIRVVMFVGYLLLIGRAADVRRTFQYHGAEHMSIHTLEGGDPLTVEAARKYPTAHPRCGTEFLVVVLIVSIVAFSFLPKLSPVGLIASRVLLVPVIAAISYELLQFGAKRRNRRFVRWLWAPGIWVQAITTRQPTDDMIEVAIVSLERALEADGNEIPAGSSDFSARPLNPETDFEPPANGSVGAVKVNAEPLANGSAGAVKVNAEPLANGSAGAVKVNAEPLANGSAGAVKVNAEPLANGSAGAVKVNAEPLANGSAGAVKVNAEGVDS